MTAAADRDSRASRFIDTIVSEDARAAFRAWKRARTGPGLPRLRDFAPFELPPRLVPWTLLYQLRADGELVYGLADEELVHLFRDNPKGRRVLDYAPDDERQAQLGVILQAVRTGFPVWFVGSLALRRQVAHPHRQAVPAGGDGQGRRDAAALRGARPRAAAAALARDARAVRRVRRVLVRSRGSRSRRQRVGHAFCHRPPEVVVGEPLPCSLRPSNTVRYRRWTLSAPR